MRLARVIFRRHLNTIISPHSASFRLAQPLIPQKRSLSNSPPASGQPLDQAQVPRAKHIRLDTTRFKSRIDRSRYLPTAPQRCDTEINSHPAASSSQASVAGGSQAQDNHPRRRPSRPSSRQQDHRRKSSLTLKSRSAKLGQLNGPLRDLAYIKSFHNPDKSLEFNPQWMDNPKSPLSNYVREITSKSPTFSAVKGTIDSKTYFR
jgi:hypothetical protein